MHEVRSESIDLTVCSPPYYNAPFDYPKRFPAYDEYVRLLEGVSKELFRVTRCARVACLVIDDMLVEGERFPIIADTISLMRESGFKYLEKITWVKPKGYSRISRRSGNVIKHPYPMYFYPDNILESILIFQKGNVDETRRSKLEYQYETNRFPHEWFKNVWQITNVLPGSPLERGIAAFPDELAMRLMKLFSLPGDTILDPFLGSGTTTKIAAILGNNSFGYELKYALKERILAKLSHQHNIDIRIEVREDCEKLVAESMVYHVADI
ncbi:MAG: DNA-methyltransferase [Nitrososphaerales archaeon]